MHYPKASQTIVLQEHHQRLRSSLKTCARHHLDAPLSQWVRCGDRGIPRYLTKRSVRQLINADFNALLAEPAVGIVKVRKLLELLERVGDGEPQDTSAAPTDAPIAVHAEVPPLDANVWQRYVQAIAHADMEAVPLGRIAESLRVIPRRMWHCPLGRFTDMNFAEFQALPYLGRHRTAVQKIVLIAAKWAVVAEAGGGAFVTWQTPSIRAAAAWIHARLIQPQTTGVADVRRNITAPLAAQCEHDLGVEVATVVDRVLDSGLPRYKTSTPCTSSEAAVTPFPQYQTLLDRIQDVAAVRWPEGRGLVQALARNSAGTQGASATTQVLNLIVDLFFPTARNSGQSRGAAHADV